MADDKDSKVLPDNWYSAGEAAPFVHLKEATLKNKLRDKDIKGKQVGSKKIWHVQGKEIIRYRKKWNLDGI